MSDDTIAAISTPAGQGGIGIVRLSGPDALAVADRIFVPKAKVPPSQCPSHTVHYGHIVDPAAAGGGPIDEALLVVMRAPRTFTREDVVEINCHGGFLPLQTVLRLALDCGARMAEPGEFTKRAFLHGRIDLTQAEAVLDIIQAKTEAFLKVSHRQLKGDLTVALEKVREHLMAVYARLEAWVNFPEEDSAAQPNAPMADQSSLPGETGAFVPAILAEVTRAGQAVRDLLASSGEGRVLKDGIRAVICGKPNVGKSSLLNKLLQQPRAIVSPIAGTTRDTIEELVQLNGVPFQLVDTAGILHPRDPIEEEAVRRSRFYAESADMVLLVLDQSCPLTGEDEDLMTALAGKNPLVVVNKCDVPCVMDEAVLEHYLPGSPRFRVCALEGSGLEALTTGMSRAALPEGGGHNRGLLVGNLRHIEALRDCAASLEQACQHLRSGLSWEFVSEEIKTATACLDRITGRDIDSDLLDQIFSRFCVGK